MSTAVPYLAAVCIPTFNASATIRATVASIGTSLAFYAARGGAARRCAVSVVDDASSDETVEIVRACAATLPCDLVVTALPINQGRAHARNRAVVAADADAYFFLDHDDAYLPPHIAVCLDALAAHPRADFVKTGVELSEPVHADWEPRIAASLTQNLCVRRRSHRLVGGFQEAPEVERFGCDDVLYNRTLRACLRGVDVPMKTVKFFRRHGNSFDRQFARKFSRPADDAEVTLSPEQIALQPRIAQIHAARLRDVQTRLHRLRRLGQLGRGGLPARTPTHG